MFLFFHFRMIGLGFRWFELKDITDTINMQYILKGVLIRPYTCININFEISKILIIYPNHSNCIIITCFISFLRVIGFF